MQSCTIVKLTYRNSFPQTCFQSNRFNPKNPPFFCTSKGALDMRKTDNAHAVPSRERRQNNIQCACT